MAIAAYLRVSTERQDLDNLGFAVGEHYAHSCKNRHLGPVGAKMYSG